VEIKVYCDRCDVLHPAMENDHERPQCPRGPIGLAERISVVLQYASQSVLPALVYESLHSDIEWIKKRYSELKSKRSFGGAFSIARQDWLRRVITTTVENGFQGFAAKLLELQTDADKLYRHYQETADGTVQHWWKIGYSDGRVSMSRDVVGAFTAWIATSPDLVEENPFPEKVPVPKASERKQALLPRVSETEIEQARREGYEQGWNDCDRARDPDTAPEILALKEKHRSRWWRLSFAERMADMAEYAAAKAQKPPTWAQRSLVETLNAAAAAMKCRVHEAVVADNGVDCENGKHKLICRWCGFEIDVQETNP
jgi:hypothetical protein